MPGFGGQSGPKLMNVPPPAPVMGGLNSLFQSIMGGAQGAGATALGTLQATAAGAPGSPGSPTDVTALYDSIKKASAVNQQQGQAQIESTFAAAGGGMSSDLMKQLSLYNTNYGSQLDSTLANLTYQSTEAAAQRQMQASLGLADIFGNAAMTYAPTAQVVGGATDSNIGSSAMQFASMMAMIGLMAS